MSSISSEGVGTRSLELFLEHRAAFSLYSDHYLFSTYLTLVTCNRVDVRISRSKIIIMTGETKSYRLQDLIVGIYNF